MSEAEKEIDLSKGNPGWADVLNTILHTKKPKRKKSIILSKAKKLCDVKKNTEEPLPFEIEGEDGEIKHTLPTNKQEGETKDHPEVDTTRKSRRKEHHLGIRIKPSVLDKERERTLQKIATKGVVQLFNVVKQQQMEISTKLEQVGPLERKRTEVLKNVDKNTFLDTLMGGTKSVEVDESVKPVKKDEDCKTKKNNGLWNVLRDDFVMNASMKDWDKQNSNSEDSEASESEEICSDG